MSLFVSLTGHNEILSMVVQNTLNQNYDPPAIGSRPDDRSRRAKGHTMMHS